MIGHVRLIRQHNLASLSTKRGEEMSDALTRLALAAPTDAAARRIFEGGERDARDDPAARPRLLEHDALRWWLDLVNRLYRFDYDTPIRAAASVGAFIRAFGCD